ncbi:DnaJ domain-containing protein [Candidatus Microgenomates bacterium]|nr:DnaJ domain-containing protein [Candidatus Microgenomates bacterium]
MFQLKKIFWPKFNFPRFLLILILLIFGLGLLTGYIIFGQNRPQIVRNQSEKEIHSAFLMEIYDKILENYWDNISEEQLAQLFKQASEKIVGKPQKLQSSGKTKSTPNPVQAQLQTGNTSGLSINLQGSSINDLKILNQDDNKPPTDQKQALQNLLQNILKDLEDSKKKEFTKTLAATILSGLTPPGRSGLFTQKQEEQLKNTVQNVNPEKDLYKDLGLAKGASQQDIQKSYQEKEEELKKDTSPQAQEELKKIAYAKDVLTDQDKKKNYDTKGVEPTTNSKLISADIAYLKFDKFSPTTYEEFVKIVKSYDKQDGPKALIFDLRGNIGGAIDALPFFLGNFLGDKQYVYDFMRKGELEPYKTVGTKLAGLARMKQVVILVDNQTQSSAELLAVALKRYRYGVVLGIPTKGWGTVEKVFNLENQFDPSEKFSLFLVHSLTLRDDGQPLEGRGLEPDINIKETNWEEKLFEYFRNPSLGVAIKSVL